MATVSIELCAYADCSKPSEAVAVIVVVPFLGGLDAPQPVQLATCWDHAIHIAQAVLAAVGGR